MSRDTVAAETYFFLFLLEPYVPLRFQVFTDEAFFNLEWFFLLF